MELTKEKWSKSDIKDFQNFLISKSKPEKIEWTKKIINTEMPVLAIPTPDIKAIVKEIHKGNFMDFLKLEIWEYFENTSIYGNLICLINDFDTFVPLLKKYSEKADNWATCDLLTFSNMKKDNKEKFYQLTLDLIKSPKPFVRRTGIKILFKLVDDGNYINKIFDVLNNFEDENEYYVNMINAWLFAECFTKQREKTLLFLEKNKLNKFTINKGIQKCRDSFRISKEDKEMLLNYKK